MKIFETIELGSNVWVCNTRKGTEIPDVYMISNSYLKTRWFVSLEMNMAAVFDLKMTEIYPDIYQQNEKRVDLTTNISIFS